MVNDGRSFCRQSGINTCSRFGGSSKKRCMLLHPGIMPSLWFLRRLPHHVDGHIAAVDVAIPLELQHIGALDVEDGMAETAADD